MTTIPELPAAGTLTAAELMEVAQPSTSVTITATTISAAAADNSYNDSGSGFVAAGFAVDDYVNVTGFTGDTANNILIGKITALTTAKMTIGGTDGDVIVDDAAGESVTITKWVSAYASISDIVALAATNSRNLLKVVAATTAAATLSTDFENGDTLDGVTLATGDWVLIKDQSAGAENGVYEVAASGAPSRVSEADSSEELAGLAVYVMEGSTQADTLWTCTTDEPITVDTTALTFAEFTSGGGSVAAQEGGSNVVAAATAFNFNATDFDVTDEGSNVAGVALAADLVAGGYGGLELIGIYDLSATGQTLDSGNEIDIDVSGYHALEISMVEGAVGSSDNFGLRFSDDGGSTFKTGASDYVSTALSSASSNGLTATSAQISMAMTGTAGLASIGRIFGFNNADVKPSVLVNSSRTNSSANQMRIAYLDASHTGIDTVRFYSENGNAFTAGTLVVYGARTQPVKSGAGFVERTYPATLSISAAASGAWTIPDNCISVRIVGEAQGGSSGLFTVAIGQSLTRLDSIGPGTESRFASTTDFAYANYTASDYISIDCLISNPSSTTAPTTFGTRLIGSSDTNFFNAVQNTPAASTTITIATNTGTLTGDFEITYTVREAEVGYKKELYTATDTLTLADVPASVTIDTSGGAVALTLPASAPVGTIVKAILVDVTSAATIVAATGERMNGVTTGTFTFTGSAAYEKVSLERVEYDTGLYEWVAIGDGSVA